MDTFTLEKLEFDAVRQILSRYCRCALGRGLALRIGPSRRPETIRRWLDETSQMVQALVDAGPPPFGGITDIHEVMGRARPGGGASGDDFSAIASTLEGAGAVARWGAALSEPLGLLRELTGLLPAFAQEVEAIRDVVDARGQVMDAASETLARARREINLTRQRIHEVIYGYVRRPDVSRILQNPVVSLHEDRFVLPVKAEHRHQLPGVIHRASNTGATVFVEPAESVELNNRLVELMDDERREIVRLLNELAIRIERRHDDILSALRTLAQTDLLAAKAQYATEFEFTCPELAERGPLQLHQARHPLLIEQACQDEARGTPAEARRKVVPIDVRLGVDFDVLIITGSNTGGKTVTLKTLGLLAAMAQSGLHIPAHAGSTLPLLRDVLLDVGDEQSLQQSLSTFGAHVRRINHILRAADRYSLVLLDELGSGTDPDEGAAIGQAVLDELRRVGCLAMVSTHLSALKAYAFNHERVDNASVEFDTRTLRPTYRLKIGEPGESHAITVAAAMGLPRAVIQAARRHLSEQGAAFRKAIKATYASRRASEAARGEAHTARMAAQAAQEEYLAKLNQVQQVQEQFEAWLASLSELKAGDKVNVPRMNKQGTLARVQFNKQLAIVDVENVQVEVPLSELMPNLGQQPVREEMANVRQELREQLRQARTMGEQARRLQAEYHRSLTSQRLRQQQYEAWVTALAQAQLGDEVTISRPPGVGTLTALDVLAGQAKVHTHEGQELTLPVQELFPQTGPFAPVQKRHAAADGKRVAGAPPVQGVRVAGVPPAPGGTAFPGRAGDPNRGALRLGTPAQAEKPVPPGTAAAETAATRRAAAEQARREQQLNRPMPRGHTAGGAAKTTRQAVLAVPPGEQVYVVPFHKRATLIRFNLDKDQAVVSAGAFEVTVPIADLEPAHDEPPPRPGPPHPPAGPTERPPQAEAPAPELPPPRSPPR